MRESQKCCGKLAEVTVDDIWQIANAGDKELRRLAHSSRFPGSCDQTSCSILNMLQLVHDLLRRGRQNSYNDERCDEGVDQCLYRLNAQRAMNRSQLPKPEETCLADI